MYNVQCPCKCIYMYMYMYIILYVCKPRLQVCMCMRGGGELGERGSPFLVINASLSLCLHARFFRFLQFLMVQGGQSLMFLLCIYKQTTISGYKVLCFVKMSTISTRTKVPLHIYMYMQLHVHVHAGTRACTCTNVHVEMYMYMYVCISVYMAVQNVPWIIFQSTSPVHKYTHRTAQLLSAQI